MAFKMKGSAFKLGSVATKSVLKQQSPMKDNSGQILARAGGIYNDEGEKTGDVDISPGSEAYIAAKDHDKRHYEYKSDPDNYPAPHTTTGGVVDEEKSSEGWSDRARYDEMEGGLPMKSAFKHKAATMTNLQGSQEGGVSHEQLKRHDRRHSQGEKHNSDGDWGKEENTPAPKRDEYGDLLNNENYVDGVKKEPALPMKSPLEQYREQMFGTGKREKRKKYMSNKEYYELYPELKPAPKDNIFRDVDKDGNVITRGLRNIGKAIGNIKIKGGGRGGYEMGPGGRGGWRG